MSYYREEIEEPCGTKGLLSTVVQEEVQAESPATMPAKGAHEVPDMLLQGFQNKLSTR